ncbi:MAG: hypothetical protein IJV48_04065 [Ruminococcus sp.]|nr:hypothetical protein [Ruminococcus sp.]
MDNEILVGKILRAFKSVGMTIAGFAKSEGFNVKVLYNLSCKRKASDDLLNQIIYCLQHNYPRQYEKIMKIVEVTE